MSNEKLEFDYVPSRYVAKSYIIFSLNKFNSFFECPLSNLFPTVGKTAWHLASPSGAEHGTRLDVIRTCPLTRSRSSFSLGHSFCKIAKSCLNKVRYMFKQRSSKLHRVLCKVPEERIHSGLAINIPLKYLSPFYILRICININEQFWSFC